MVGLKLESEAHPGYTGQLTEFSCENLEADVTGGVIGTVSKDINVISKESEVVDLATESIGDTRIPRPDLQTDGEPARLG